jgi:hypothetical protein
MAMPTENLNYTNPSSGSGVSTDRITVNGVIGYAQRIKLGLGVPGGFTDDLHYGQSIAASSVPVVIASDQTAYPVNANITNSIISTNANVPNGVSVGQSGNWMVGMSGTMNIAAGNLTIQQSGAWWVGISGNIAQSTGGFDSVFTTQHPTGILIKSSAAHIGGWSFYNNSSAVIFIKLYDKATLPVQTDFPKLTIGIPPNSGRDLGEHPGIQFTSGLGIIATSGAIANAVSVPPSGTAIVNIWYK